MLFPPFLSHIVFAKIKKIPLFRTNRKTGKIFSRYHFRWRQKRPPQSRVTTATRPLLLSFRISCGRSKGSSLFRPAAFHQTGRSLFKGRKKTTVLRQRVSYDNRSIIPILPRSCQGVPETKSKKASGAAAPKALCAANCRRAELKTTLGLNERRKY